MRKTPLLLLTALSGMLLVGAASCKKNYFDQETYDSIVSKYSSVENIDVRQTWQMTTEMQYRLTASAGERLQQVMLLSGNPFSETSVEVMNQTSISRGETVTLAASVPETTTQLYAALVDSTGTYYVTSFGKTQYEVDCTGAIQGKPKATLRPQMYTCLFEENFPAPGDYDYNDLVLRLATERTGEKQMTIHVTVAAVGADNQVAGCLRLIGFKKEDIDGDVTTLSGQTFNDGLPQGSTGLMSSTDILQEGRNQEAVICLFADAHWAMGYNIGTEYGLFTRKKYNVASSSGDGYQNKTVRTQSFVVNFKSEESLNYFTLETLDPFIVTAYNMGRYETHLHNLRAAQVLYKYSVSPTTNALPWALMVPQRDFHYPLEGVQMCYRKSTSTGVVVMNGAYIEEGHSFGEWAQNYLKSTDWYQYPYDISVW